jgi:hypothetical protein
MSAMSIAKRDHRHKTGHPWPIIALALMSFLLILGSTAMATEEPPFSVVHHEGAFEVRAYPALMVAEVEVRGDRNEAASEGFRLLAGYIFGGNTSRQSLAMTAPVTQASGSTSQDIAMTAPVVQTPGNDRSWIIQFVMPDGSTMASLPIPNDPRVHLREQPASHVAVVRFSGLTSQSDIDKHTADLRGFMDRQGLHPAGSPSVARYDPPWTLWFLRRNEVWIPVTP